MPITEQPERHIYSGWNKRTPGFYNDELPGAQMPEFIAREVKPSRRERLIKGTIVTTLGAGALFALSFLYNDVERPELHTPTIGEQVDDYNQCVSEFTADYYADTGDSQPPSIVKDAVCPPVGR